MKMEEAIERGGDVKRDVVSKERRKQIKTAREQIEIGRCEEEGKLENQSLSIN